MRKCKRLLCALLAFCLLGIVPITQTEAAGNIYWPLDTKWGITTGYYYSNGSPHYGVDMLASQGSPIYATFDGTAVYYQVYTTIGGVNYLTSYGNCVYLTGNNGYFAIFGHMNSFNGFSLVIPSSRTKSQSGNTGKIKIGTKQVKEGDVLGYVGTTGRSSGNHLHYGLKINGAFVNPTGYLNKSMSAKEHANSNRPSVSLTKDSRYPTPITAYPAATSGKVTVYNSYMEAYSQSARYIAWDDLCTIHEVYTNGYCRVTYPVSGGTHTEYAKASDFIANAVEPYAYTPNANLTTYARSNLSNAFGSVFTTDRCTVVGKNGDKLELIYPVSGGYKLGWISVPVILPSDFPTPLKAYNASPTVRTTVYESLNTMGTYYGQIFVDDQCTLNAVNVKEGWIQVTYPVGNATKAGYVYLDQFIPSDSRLAAFYTTTVTQQSTSYRKSDMGASYGYVSASDPITVVGKSGNKLQVIYSLDAGGYKLAWIYNTYVKKNLTGISVTSNPKKTSYLEGESLDTSGLVVTAQYDDGSTADVTGSCAFSGYSSTVGVKTVNVSYGGKQTAFTVSVKGKSLTEVRITKNPDKMDYYVGDGLRLGGLEVQAVYDNGSTAQVTDYDIQGDDNLLSTPGKKDIMVTYTYNGATKSASFQINVTKPSIQLPQTSLSMGQGDTAALTAVTEPSSQPVSWKSSDVSVAAVSEGKVTAVGSGKAIVTASFAYQGIGYQAEVSVTVKEEPENPAYKPGDVNGDGAVNMKDYALFRQFLDDWDVKIQEAAADVNADGRINGKDACLLQQYLDGWEVELKFPAPEEEPGQDARYTKEIYGQSELGRDLVYYCFEPEHYTSTVLLNFAIHGYEDEYNGDGQALVDTANSLIAHYNGNLGSLADTRLIIVPCANPDGLYEGTTNNGFGRCNAKGIDLNRDFDANYKPYTTARNYTPYAFSAAESRALRDLVKATGPSVVIDFHGWLDYTIGNYELAQVFRDEMGLSHYVDFTTTNASGYFSNWAYQQGALGLLVEFTDSHTVPFQGLVRAVDRILSGDYDKAQKEEKFAQFDAINCYALSKGRVTTYQFFDEPFQSASYIDGAADLVTILEVYGNGWAKVQYPVSSGSKVAYAPLKEFIPEGQGTESLSHMEILENTTVYRRRGLEEKFGTVYPTEGCFVAAESENALQVIYKLDAGGWKMGWIPKPEGYFSPENAEENGGSL